MGDDAGKKLTLGAVYIDESAGIPDPQGGDVAIAEIDLRNVGSRQRLDLVAAGDESRSADVDAAFEKHLRLQPACFGAGEVGTGAHVGPESRNHHRHHRHGPQDDEQDHASRFALLGWWRWVTHWFSWGSVDSLVGLGTSCPCVCNVQPADLGSMQTVSALFSSAWIKGGITSSPEPASLTSTRTCSGRRSGIVQLVIQVENPPRGAR